MTQVTYLDEESPIFPDTRQALDEPNGLLAAGGNLSTSTLIDAYSRGIFPWFSQEQPILWWSPSPRMILEPNAIYINRSTKKLARKKPFQITVDTCFADVISHCANSERPEQDGTWIDNCMQMAYCELHNAGVAHSIEAWQGGRLVGGLYGIAIGKAFFGESMFSLCSGASKLCFTSLCLQLSEWKFELIDCQMHTDYLASFGAHEISREQFELKLKSATSKAQHINWQAQWSQTEHGFDGHQ